VKEEEEEEEERRRRRMRMRMRWWEGLFHPKCPAQLPFRVARPPEAI